MSLSGIIHHSHLNAHVCLCRNIFLETGYYKNYDTATIKLFIRLVLKKLLFITEEPLMNQALN